jgi:hypothetical protein
LLLHAVLLAGVAIATVVTLAANSHSGQYGFDFDGIWRAAHAIMHGANPYPAPNPARFALTGNPYVLPPVAGLVTAWFVSLPFIMAMLLCNVACVASLVGALWLVGVRDWRIYLISLCSFPFVSSLVLGQPDGVLALLAAVAWRYRDSWRAAAAVALLIAIKILAWPLLLWLLFTRRFRQAATAALGAGLLLVVSWALISFHSLTDYPQLLSADAKAFATRSHSIAALLEALGCSAASADVLAVAAAGVIAIMIVWRASDRDLAGFTAALSFGLLCSPILWSHWLVLLLVPLAIRRPQLHPTWFIVAALWLSPTENPANIAQLVIVLGLVAFALLGDAGRPLPVGRVPEERQRQLG